MPAMMITTDVKTIAIGVVHAIQFSISYTRPKAKPLAMYLRTNQIAKIPGSMVITPAVESRVQSKPPDVTVLVIAALIGLASVLVMVRAINNSTQLNMKQKNAVTPIPDLIIGRKILIKKRGSE
jgi:hypothetical protein